MRVELQNVHGLDMGHIEFSDGAAVPRQGERIRHESSDAPGTTMDSEVHSATSLTRDSALYAVRLVVGTLPTP